MTATVTLPSRGGTFQHQPELAALANGSFIAVWTDDTWAFSTGATINEVRAQRLNADGTLLGPAFRVNSTDLNTMGVSSHSPTVTVLTNDRFIVGWLSGNDSGPVRAQVYNADGTPSGAELLVATPEHAYTSTPSFTALANGGFVATWTDVSTSGADTSGWSVHAQVFDFDGSKNGSEFLINTTTNNSQEAPQLASLQDGRFVATWVDQSLSPDDPSGSAIRSQIFNSDGSKSGVEFLVNTTTVNSQMAPTLTGLSNGHFVIAWENGTEIRAQIFNADGSHSGGEFLATPEDVSGSSFAQLHPSITALADGRFAMGWEELGGPVNPDGSISALLQPHNVHLQIFNADGSKAGSEIQTDALTMATQVDPVVTTLVDGRIAASWTASAAPGGIGGESVQIQIFDPRTEALQWTSASPSVDIVGTRWADTIVLNAGQNTVHAAQGNDTVDGGSGDDWIHGGFGNDLIFGNDGNDTLMGGGGNDTIFGGAGNDVLRAGRYMDGGDGDDTLIGAQGTDQMLGGSGNDVLRGSGFAAGGDGNDTYYIGATGSLFISESNSVNSGNDTAVSLDTIQFSNVNGSGMADGVLLFETYLTPPWFENIENLRLIGLNSVDAWGSDIANRITGNSGNNELRGFGGNDTLMGGAGQDTLYGGEGKDRLTGGADADIFAFRMPQEIGNGAGRDVVTDFTVGVDKIDLTSIDADPMVFGYQSLSFIGNAAFSHTAGELRYSAFAGILTGDTNGDGIADFQLQLIGKPALTAADLML